MVQYIDVNKSIEENLGNVLERLIIRHLQQMNAGIPGTPVYLLEPQLTRKSRQASMRGSKRA